jgi:hypothetical protein
MREVQFTEAIQIPYRLGAGKHIQICLLNFPVVNLADIQHRLQLRQTHDISPTY